mmetsp:Transcript_27040/g.87332  ORF Transcript_27040/g.87332 Transcript_27040/m.87332 type:complete len:254 (+) Transcript_27040:361-1122(+)
MHRLAPPPLTTAPLSTPPAASPPPAPRHPPTRGPAHVQATSQGQLGSGAPRSHSHLQPACAESVQPASSHLQASPAEPPMPHRLLRPSPSRLGDPTPVQLRPHHRPRLPPRLLAHSCLKPPWLPTRPSLHPHLPGHQRTILPAANAQPQPALKQRPRQPCTTLPATQPQPAAEQAANHRPGADASPPADRNRGCESSMRPANRVLHLVRELPRPSLHQSTPLPPPGPPPHPPTLPASNTTCGGTPPCSSLAPR